MKYYDFSLIFRFKCIPAYYSGKEGAKSSGLYLYAILEFLLKRWITWGKNLI